MYLYNIKPPFLCSLRHCIHTGSGAHQASYPMGTGGSSPGGTEVGAWSWTLTCI